MIISGCLLRVLGCQEGASCTAVPLTGVFGNFEKASHQSPRLQWQCIFLLFCAVVWQPKGTSQLHRLPPPARFLGMCCTVGANLVLWTWPGATISGDLDNFQPLTWCPKECWPFHQGLLVICRSSRFHHGETQLLSRGAMVPSCYRQPAVL